MTRVRLSPTHIPPRPWSQPAITWDTRELGDSVQRAAAHLAHAECEGEGLVPVHGGVELDAGAELARVVHRQLITRPRHAAAPRRAVLNLAWGEHLLCSFLIIPDKVTEAT